MLSHMNSLFCCCETEFHFDRVKIVINHRIETINTIGMVFILHIHIGLLPIPFDFLEFHADDSCYLNQYKHFFNSHVYCFDQADICIDKLSLTGTN